MKMIGTEKQISYAADMVAALITKSRSDLSGLKRYQRNLLTEMGDALACFEAMQEAGEPVAAQALADKLSDDSAGMLMSMMGALAPRRLGYKSPADLLTKPAEAELVIDFVKGAYHNFCRPSVHAA